MPSQSLRLVGVMHVKKGKADEVIALLSDNAAHIRDNEPGVLHFEINRSLKPAKDGSEEVVLVEEYKDAQTLKEHGETAQFKNFQKRLAELDALRGPPLLKIVRNAGGFAPRL